MKKILTLNNIAGKAIRIIHVTHDRCNIRELVRSQRLKRETNKPVTILLRQVIYGSLTSELSV